MAYEFDPADLTVPPSTAEIKQAVDRYLDGERGDQILDQFFDLVVRFHW